MTKDYVLAILIRENTYVSGEKISNDLGISRAAVNTAVKSLRADGYDILSTTNKGYFLNNKPDKLTTGELLGYLSDERMQTVMVVDTIDSTNKKLKELGYDGAPEGQIVVANHQSVGRGRLGRSFMSPPDTGIYLSVLLRPTVAPSEISTITAWTSVAVSNAIYNACGIKPGIKWVNDLVLNKRKICGILTELSVESETGRIDNVVIGIGINVNNKSEDFPEELRGIATSISIENDGKVFSRSKIAAELIKELDKLIASWPNAKNEYLDMYRNLSITTGSEVTIIPTGSTVNDKNVEHGTAIAINDDFSLQVKLSDGTTKALSSGEVSVRGLYGYT